MARIPDTWYPAPLPHSHISNLNKALLGLGAGYWVPGTGFQVPGPGTWDLIPAPDWDRRRGPDTEHREPSPTRTPSLHSAPHGCFFQRP